MRLYGSAGRKLVYMSATRTASTLLKSAGTALAVVVLILSSWGIADAQVLMRPAGWPASAPLAATRGSAVIISAAELAYYKNLVAADPFTNTGVGRQPIAEIESCIARQSDDQILNECSSDELASQRNSYIDYVLLRTEDEDTPTNPLDPTTPTPPVTPGTGDTGTGDTGTDVSQNGLGAGGDACNFFKNGNLVECIAGSAGKLGASILWVFVSLFGWMLGVVGMFFNWVMFVTVFQYSTYFGNSAGILLAWSILRDIGNIVLLFGFIFIGLQTILNIGHFSVGRALPRLVLFAILINFSLFISEAVVDISNVLSASFYSYASGSDCTEFTSNSECTNNGIAGLVIKAAGIGGILDFGEFGNNFAEIWGAPDGIQMFVLYAGMSIFLIIMIVVLGAAAIMFMVRAITLMLLLVVSPLAFAGLAIPQFEEQSKKWWSSLISQSFFAPIFLLMIFVGLKIMEGAQGIFNAGNVPLSTALGATNVTAGGVFILFTLMIGFMVAALMSAKQFGAVGASFAVNTAAGVTAGTIGFAGRRTVGFAGSKLGSMAEKSDFLKKRPGLGRMVLATTDAASKGSYDFRQAYGVKGAAKAAGFSLGDPNKTASHGYHGIHEKAQKEREAYDKRMKPTDEQQAMAKEADTELEELEGKRREALAGKKQEVTSQVTKIAEMRKKGVDDALIKSEQRTLDRLEKEYQEADKKFLEGTMYNERGADGKFTGGVKVGDRMKALKTRKATWSGEAKADMTRDLMEGYEQSGHSLVGKVSAGGHADHEAYERLRAGGKLTDVEKALATISKQLKQNDQNEAARDEKAQHAAPPVGGTHAGGDTHGKPHG